MSLQHRELAAGRWKALTFVEQMANVGSEVERALDREAKGPGRGRLAFERALELLDLTVSDPKNRKRLRELLRVREALADYFVFDNTYRSTDEAWRRCFRFFLFAARGNR